MNKVLKIIIAIMGGIDAIFNIVTPLALSLLLITIVKNTGQVSDILLITIGMISSFFRAIKIGWIKGW